MSTISGEQVRELLSLAEQKAGSLRDAHALLYKFADYAEVVAALCREWLAQHDNQISVNRDAKGSAMKLSELRKAIDNWFTTSTLDPVVLVEDVDGNFVNVVGFEATREHRNAVVLTPETMPAHLEKP